MLLVRALTFPVRLSYRTIKAQGRLFIDVSFSYANTREKLLPMSGSGCGCFQCCTSSQFYAPLCLADVVVLMEIHDVQTLHRGWMPRTNQAVSFGTFECFFALLSFRIEHFPRSRNTPNITHRVGEMQRSVQK